MDDIQEKIGGIGPMTRTVVGGMVFGGTAKYMIRERLTKYKYLDGSETADDLIALVGITRPVIFTGVEFDDGTSRKQSHKSSESAVVSLLRERLAMGPEDVVDLLSRELKLTEPVSVGLLEIIKSLVSVVRRKKPKAALLAIDGDVGFLLDEVGREDFEICVDEKKNKHAPATLVEVVLELGRLACPMMPPDWSPPELIFPKRPMVMPSLERTEPVEESIVGYVRAIMEREYGLVEHLTEVEEYNIAIGKLLEQVAESI